MKRHEKDLPKWYINGWYQLDEELEAGLITLKEYKNYGRELEEELKEYFEKVKKFGKTE